jgi:hypothetical protein
MAAHNIHTPMEEHSGSPLSHNMSGMDSTGTLAASMG